MGIVLEKAKQTDGCSKKEPIKGGRDTVCISKALGLYILK
jgi:hypothetical protein